jgi:acyl carrier protein
MHGQNSDGAATIWPMADQSFSTDTETRTTEKQLAEIFRAALRLNSVGYDDNFVDMGGDSMSAMLCISRIRAAFGIELTVEDFFLDTGSIRSIAAMIDSLRATHSVDH